MGKDDQDLLERAERELEAARKATHPRAARAHFHLAGLLFDRFFRRPSAHGRHKLSLKFGGDVFPRIPTESERSR